MAKVIEAPGSLDEVKKDRKLTIFLAGSIEQGKAEDWQTRVTKALADEEMYVLNPRRKDWDDSWKEDIKNDQFREQVEWELESQELADIIIMYFDPPTKSPISLLELGLFAKTGKMIVCCPQGFWKKGNVDIVCKRYEVKQVDTIDSLIAKLKEALK